MANEQRNVSELLSTLGADRFGLIVVDGETKKSITEISFLKRPVTEKTEHSRAVINHGLNLLRESLFNHLGLNEPEVPAETPTDKTI